MSTENLIQFAPFQSFVSSTFWHKLAESKLDHDRLSDSPKQIFGYYTNRNAKACLLEVDYAAFNSETKPPKFSHGAHGIIFNTNTIEEFKERNKTELLRVEGIRLVEDIKSGRVLDDPRLLARFFVLSFADLKCHNFYYWFAFPCPLTDNLTVQSKPYKLKNIQDYQILKQILETTPYEHQNFFIVSAGKYLNLKEALNEGGLEAGNADKCYFCFADPSEFEYPAWLMRTYAAFIYHQCPGLIGKVIKFLGIRYDQQMRPDDSLIWEVVNNSPTELDEMENVKFVGWEPNRNKKMCPRMVSMRDSMDTTRLAESSVNLNLKLMKWRLVPDLNLEILASTKCLLFGAGTLGCAVARNLLSWGFKHITLIDNGKVGFSNPVRQNLYTHADAEAGNKMKATTAAQRLREINPCVLTTGHVMEIPMPGHTIGESFQVQTDNDLNLIAKLTQEHDVIFLLTDSRESRWLPTLLGAAHSKIVLNAALGFDSYLVMRHGSKRQTNATDTESGPTQVDGLKCILGNDLGCYFCNDVTAPGNSLKDRTLDQQCTVTRPGVSNIAASYAVELLVSLLQHPQRGLAPAYFSNSGSVDTSKIPEGLLGIIPHSIRGMLFNFENILPATQKFTQCIACSETILSEYRKNGNKFLFKVFESAKYLEDLTGISEFKALDNEIIDFTDSDLEMSDD